MFSVQDDITPLYLYLANSFYCYINVQNAIYLNFKLPLGSAKARNKNCFFLMKKPKLNFTQNLVKQVEYIAQTVAATLKLSTDRLFLYEK